MSFTESAVIEIFHDVFFPRLMSGELSFADE